jgi:cell division protein FtsB
MRSRSVTWSQFVAIILVTVALAITLDFGRRAAVNAELKREVQQLERDVATLEAEGRALEAQYDRVQTDAYVEEWARTEGGMVLKGETPLVPVPAEPALPSENGVSEVLADEPAFAGRAAGASGHWEEWWAFFFGPVDISQTE